MMPDNKVAELRRAIHDDLIDKSSDGWSGDAWCISVENATDVAMRVFVPMLEAAQAEVANFRDMAHQYRLAKDASEAREARMREALAAWIADARERAEAVKAMIPDHYDMHVLGSPGNDAYRLGYHVGLIAGTLDAEAIMSRQALQEGDQKC